MSDRSFVKTPCFRAAQCLSQVTLARLGTPGLWPPPKGNRYVTISRTRWNRFEQVSPLRELPSFLDCFNPYRLFRQRVDLGGNYSTDSPLGKVLLQRFDRWLMARFGSVHSSMCDVVFWWTTSIFLLLFRFAQRENRHLNHSFFRFQENIYILRDDRSKFLPREDRTRNSTVTKSISTIRPIDK